MVVIRFSHADDPWNLDEYPCKTGIRPVSTDERWLKFEQLFGWSAIMSTNPPVKINSSMLLEEISWR
jgi:hypothetical protein